MQPSITADSSTSLGSVRIKLAYRKVERGSAFVAVSKIIAQCVEDVTNHLAEAVEHLDDIECVMLLKKLDAIISMLLATANQRAVESTLGEEPPDVAKCATVPEVKPPQPDDDGIPAFLRRQPS